jgi:hypothetical protein
MIFASFIYAVPTAIVPGQDMKCGTRNSDHVYQWRWQYWWQPTSNKMDLYGLVLVDKAIVDMKKQQLLVNLFLGVKSHVYYYIRN